MKAILWRDLKLTLGAGGGFGQGLGFFLVVIFLFVLAIGADSQLLHDIAAELVYVATLLAGLLSLDRIFARDVEDGTLSQLKLAPSPMTGIIIAKCLVHWITTGLALTLLTPIIGILLNLSQGEILRLCLSLFIGTPALSLIGAIGAALTVSITRSSLIQALITLPLYIPTLIFGTQATGDTPRALAALTLLAGLTIFALVLAPLTCAYILKRQQI